MLFYIRSRLWRRPTPGSKHRRIGDMAQQVAAPVKELGRLWWLADAPLFADSDLVRRLHEAVLWPELADAYTEHTKFDQVTSALEGVGKIGGEAGLELPDWLSFLKPKLQASISGEVKGSRATTEETTSTVRGQVIDSSERRLIELTLFYLANFPDRVLFVDAPGAEYTNYRGPVESATLQKLLESPPRPLVLLDINQQTPIYPTMAEMEAGGFKRVFESLDKELFKDTDPAPEYPSDDKDDSARKVYWDSVRTKFKSRTAMQVLEHACSDGRIGWIDFRLLFNNDGRTAHLHVVPAGRYHAGVFGYNFVHRGYRFGCRIVGSLKAGNDVNVLAIYER